MRVQFTLNMDQFVRTSGRYDGRAAEDRWQAAEWIGNVFRLSQFERARLRQGHNAKIECSAEEFVRFQIERCDRGYINRFRDLKVRVKDADLPLFVAGKETRVTEDVPVMYPLDTFNVEVDSTFVTVRRKKHG